MPQSAPALAKRPRSACAALPGDARRGASSSTPRSSPPFERGASARPCAARGPEQAAAGAQVQDFVDRYMPAYHAYLPGMYAAGPTTARPGHVLIVEIDERRSLTPTQPGPFHGADKHRGDGADKHGGASHGADKHRGDGADKHRGDSPDKHRGDEVSEHRCWAPALLSILHAPVTSLSNSTMTTCA